MKEISGEKFNIQNTADIKTLFNNAIDDMSVIQIAVELGLNKHQAYSLKKRKGTKVDINRLLEFLYKIQNGA